MTEGHYEAAIREFIDFVNRQVGVFTDACAGFAKNRVIVERQVMRISRPHGMTRDEAGQKVVMHTSLEDPSQPDVIHHRIVRSGDFIAENSEEGDHEQQQARAIVVFLFAFWEHEIRPRLARAAGVDTEVIKSDTMGDLRVLRHAILHNKSRMSPDRHSKLTVLKEMFQPDGPLLFTHAGMHTIFAKIKQDLARLLLAYLGEDNPPVDPKEIVDLAIQYLRPRKP